MGRGITWDDKLDAKVSNYEFMACLGRGNSCINTKIAFVCNYLNFGAQNQLRSSGEDYWQWYEYSNLFPLQSFQIIQVANPVSDCTPNAIRHRLARIKLKADEGNSASSSPAKTPNSKAGGGHGKMAKKRNANDSSNEEPGDIKKVKQEHVQESDTDE